jgi:hypothetical protein
LGLYAKNRYFFTFGSCFEIELGQKRLFLAAFELICKFPQRFVKIYALIFHLMKKVDELYGCKERTEYAQNNVAHIQHALKILNGE